PCPPPQYRRREYGPSAPPHLALRLHRRHHHLHPLDHPAHPSHEDVHVNALDWLVLLGTMLGIALYGVWATRGRRDLNTYLRGEGNTRWIVIGLSVMATQASAVTFLSTPGQGFES